MNLTFLKPIFWILILTLVYSTAGHTSEIVLINGQSIEANISVYADWGIRLDDNRVINYLVIHSISDSRLATLDSLLLYIPDLRIISEADLYSGYFADATLPHHPKQSQHGLQLFHTNVNTIIYPIVGAEIEYIAEPKSFTPNYFIFRFSGGHHGEEGEDDFGLVTMGIGRRIQLKHSDVLVSLQHGRAYIKNVYTEEGQTHDLTWPGYGHEYLFYKYFKYTSTIS